MGNRDHHGEEGKSFDQEIREAIEKHFDEFNVGSTYYAMREIFDSKIAEIGIRKASGVKLGAKRVGVAYKTFRKMLKGNH